MGPDLREGLRWKPGLCIIALFCSAPLFLPETGQAQTFSAYGGLGVEYYKADGLSNYLNYAAPGSVQPGSFTSAIRFLAGGDCAFDSSWAVGLEYEYITKSVVGSDALGSEQVNVSYSLPSITIHKLIFGKGYSFGFGIGIGYHFGTVGTTSPYSSQTQDFSASGLGIKLDGSLDTKLDDKLYARVGVEARGEFVGDPAASDGTRLTYIDYNSGNPVPVNMHLFGVGLSFGIVYYF